MPLVLLILGLSGGAAALMLPGMGDLLLLAGPVAVAALVLLIRRRRLSPAPLRAPAAPPARRPGRAAKPADTPARPVIVDGSNVMYWRDNTPLIATVTEVLARLQARGFAPGIVFDANAGYLLTGRHQNDAAFARLLDLPTDRVMVVPKGEPADPVVLAAARDLGAPILSNDRYRDWAEAHPEVRAPGHVIRGEYREGDLWLDLPG